MWSSISLLSSISLGTSPSAHSLGLFCAGYVQQKTIFMPQSFFISFDSFFFFFGFSFPAVIFTLISIFFPLVMHCSLILCVYVCVLFYNLISLKWSLSHSSASLHSSLFSFTKIIFSNHIFRYIFGRVLSHFSLYWF